MLLGPGELGLPCNHGDHQRCAAGSLKQSSASQHMIDRTDGRVRITYVLKMHLKVTLCGNVFRPILQSHHDSCQQADPLPTVGVRDHVAVADGQEGDGDQPHRPQERTGHLLGIVVPATKNSVRVQKDSCLK